MMEPRRNADGTVRMAFEADGDFTIWVDGEVMLSFSPEEVERLMACYEHQPHDLHEFFVELLCDETDDYRWSWAWGEKVRQLFVDNICAIARQVYAVA